MALAFTGTDPLWNTKYASPILLATAASLIFLINSTYQDGRNVDSNLARPMSCFQRITMTAASVVLVPFVVIAAYGIALRIKQYGWTPDRILATAFTLVAACYAIGYALSAILRRASFSGLEWTNIAASFVILAILLALFTPAADPARIAVADQMGRLHDGTIAPDKLDYEFLRFNSGRYGREALMELSQQTAIPVAAAKATESLEKKSRYEARRLSPVTPNDIAANITVAQPPGQALPREFLATDWIKNKHSYLIPACLRAHAKCEAVIADLEGNGADDIILLAAGHQSSAAVFHKTGESSWDFFSTLINVGCRGVRDALIAGNFKTAPSVAKELEVGAQRLRMMWPTECSEGTVTIKSP